MSWCILVVILLYEYVQRYCCSLLHTALGGNIKVSWALIWRLPSCSTIKITLPLERISDPVSSKTCLKGHAQQKWWLLERFCREGCVDASLGVFSTPSPLSRNPSALKIVRGGVLSYHPSVIVFYGKRSSHFRPECVVSRRFCSVRQRHQSTGLFRTALLQQTLAGVLKPRVYCFVIIRCCL